MAARTPGTGLGGLLARVVASAAAIVAGLVACAAAHVPGMLVITVAALIAATAGIARFVSLLLRDADGTDPAVRPPGRRIAAPPRDRRTVAAVSAVAALAVLLAIALPRRDAVATATTPATAATATRAVRAFLSDAVVEEDAYDACQYLTPAEQQQVTRLAGHGQTCRAALTATPAGCAGIASEGAVHGLRLHAAIRDGAAIVRAGPPAGRPSTFVLPRATGAETDTYRAPACAWRIAAGATAVLARGPAHGALS